jgi:hypothetical protein
VFRRLPVLGSFFLEHKRYSLEASLRIISIARSMSFFYCLHLTTLFRLCTLIPAARSITFLPDLRPCHPRLRSAGQLRVMFQLRRLKYWSARSSCSAAARDLKVPRFRRLVVFGSFFLRYRRYSPEGNLRIMIIVLSSLSTCRILCQPQSFGVSTGLVPRSNAYAAHSRA